MKNLLLTLSILISSIATAQYSIPDDWYFDVVDIDGNTHSLQDYFDQGKSVFVFEFANVPESYLQHEAFDLSALYNTFGQGGSNEIVVLYFAGLLFEDAGDLNDIDYSAVLGTGYENVSYVTDNPIPVVLLEDNPQTDWITESVEFRMMCSDSQFAYLSPDIPESYMSSLYGLCCVGNEFFDPSLQSLTHPDQVDCAPQELEYLIKNETPILIDECTIDVLVNGEFEETITYVGPLSGCDSESLSYTNEVLQAGDEVTLAISSTNEISSNDTIHIEVTSVDTVRGQFKMEVQNAEGLYGFAAMNVSQGSSVQISETNNWYNQIFVEETGCMQLNYHAFKFEGGANQTLLITSVNENQTTQDTIVIHTGELFYFDGSKDIFIEEGAFSYPWGWIFEDPNETQTFSPAFPGIAGVQISQGLNSTFSDANGYYELPSGQSDDLEFNYDADVWHIVTTPNAGTFNPDQNIYNFGLNQNAPSWEIIPWFNTGLPFICETPLYQNISIQNVGNQTTVHLVTFTHDSNLEVDFANTTPNPIAVDGSQISFETEALPFGNSAALHIEYLPVSAGLLGEYISSSFELQTMDIDGNLISTESFSSIDSLFCAYDPNDIYGFPLGVGPEGFVDADTDLDFRIRFQNTGNFPATNVVVKHTLPEELNWNTFDPGPTSHDVQITMNSDSREIIWTFNNINLPDSTSDYEGSNGFIRYKVEMNQLDVGDQIQGVAAIYFDSNEAVITNTSLHTIWDPLSITENAIPSVEVYPNPGKDHIWLKQFRNDDVVSIQFFNSAGKIVNQQAVLSPKQAFDISNLTPGNYILVGNNKNGNAVFKSYFVKVD